MYAYCGNNPVSRIDTAGQFWDYVVDVGFIAWSVADVVNNPTSWKNWLGLTVDVVFAVAPFVPSGAGQIIKAGDKVSDSMKLLKKVTVVGESMDRVKDFAKGIGAIDNLYSGFKYYKTLVSKGKLGKVVAEVAGKASNFTWLYGKLRQGYQIVDIGIDMSKVVRSSSYALEKITLFGWKARNFLKGALHYVLGD